MSALLAQECVPAGDRVAGQPVEHRPGRGRIVVQPQLELGLDKEAVGLEHDGAGGHDLAASFV